MRAVIGSFLCALVLVSSVRAADSGSAMTVGDLQDICAAPSADRKSACRFYILGITQGLSVGMSIAEGKTKGGRPCIPDDTSSQTLELTVKMKLGQILMMFPEDKTLDASGLIGAILVNTFPCTKVQ
jgi:hypothetical protein